MLLVLLNKKTPVLFVCFGAEHVLRMTECGWVSSHGCVKGGVSFSSKCSYHCSGCIGAVLMFSGF